MEDRKFIDLCIKNEGEVDYRTSYDQNLTTVISCTVPNKNFKGMIKESSNLNPVNAVYSIRTIYLSEDAEIKKEVLISEKNRKYVVRASFRDQELIRKIKTSGPVEVIEENKYLYMFYNPFFGSLDIVYNGATINNEEFIETLKEAINIAKEKELETV